MEITARFLFGAIIVAWRVPLLSGKAFYTRFLATFTRLHTAIARVVLCPIDVMR